MSKILIVGYGSIGKKHEQAAKELGCDVEYVTSQKINNHTCYANLEEIKNINSYDIIIISNPTSMHYETLSLIERLNYKGKVLVEKPIFEDLKQKLDFINSKTYVAYNLRHHPGLSKLKDLLVGKNILSVQCYAGSYLPNWRPEQDYSKSYSSQKQMGGGVLRDLSHELDYLNWLFGPIDSVLAHGGKFSNLNINSEDTVSAIFKTSKNCVISLELNYTDRIGQRFLNINTDTETYRLDFNNSMLLTSNDSVKFDFITKDTYNLQLESLIKNNKTNMCIFDDGLRVVKIIKSVEDSIESGRWELV